MPYPCSPEIQSEVRKELKPLLAKFLVSDKMVLSFQRIGERMHRSTVLCEAFEDYVTSFFENSKSNARATNLMASFLYVFEIETMASLWIDLALLSLAADGKTLHLPPDRKHAFTRHATTLEDFESPSLSLSTKLDFLEFNGLSIFSKWVDRDLRNKVAHMDFEVEENGDFVVISKKKRRRINFMDKILKSLKYCNAATKVYREESKHARASLRAAKLSLQEERARIQKKRKLVTETSRKRALDHETSHVSS